MTDEERASRIADRLLGIHEILFPVPRYVKANHKNIVVTDNGDVIVITPHNGYAYGVRLGEPGGPRMLYSREPT